MRTKSLRARRRNGFAPLATQRLGDDGRRKDRASRWATWCPSRRCCRACGRPNSRYYLGSAPYRSMLRNFSDTPCRTRSKPMWELRSFWHRVPLRGPAPSSPASGRAVRRSLDDDLAVPAAAGRGTVRATRRGQPSARCGRPRLRPKHAAHPRHDGSPCGSLTRSTNVSGIPRRTSAALAAVDVLVQAELESRQKARDERNWALADQIRTGSRTPASKSPTPPMGRSGCCRPTMSSRHQVDGR